MSDLPPEIEFSAQWNDILKGLKEKTESHRLLHPPSPPKKIKVEHETKVSNRQKLDEFMSSRPEHKEYSLGRNNPR